MVKKNNTLIERCRFGFCILNRIVTKLDKLFPTIRNFDDKAKSYYSFLG